jgi:hypothetical protein
MPFMADGFWRAFNPSIRLSADGSKYVVNLRHANYETKEARFYTYRGKEGLIITRNVVAQLDANFRVVGSPFEIQIPEGSIVNKTTAIHGFEDCRWLGESSLIATSRQFRSPASETNTMVRVDLDGTATRAITVLNAPVPREDNECQKNWLPFVWRGQEVFVYKINPFMVFTMKGHQKLVDWSPPASSGITFDNLRGSAPPVPWKSAEWPREALVMVAHFCYYGAGDEGRRYYHRFITLNDDLTPSRISRIFSLCDDKIQYVAGMCHSLDGKGLVLTYGVGDSQAWAAEVATEVVEKSLEYSLNA